MIAIAMMIINLM